MYKRVVRKPQLESQLLNETLVYFLNRNRPKVSVSAMNVSIPALPDSIPPSILASADLLVTKTAYLSGMVAAETAVCMSRLLMDFDAHCSKIIDEYHTEPEVPKDALNSANQQSNLEKIPELRRRIVAALAHYYRLLQTPDRNGVLYRHPDDVTSKAGPQVGPDGSRSQTVLSPNGK